MGRARLRFWEIDRLTMPEMAILLDDDMESPRIPQGSGRSVKDHIAWLRSMTLRQRLEAMQRGEL